MLNSQVQQEEDNISSLAEPIITNGYRSCVVKEGFLRVLSNIGYIYIKRKVNKTIKEINEEMKSLEKSIEESEEKIASFKKIYGIEQDMEKISTSYFLPQKKDSMAFITNESLLEYYQKRVEILNKIKEHQKKRIQKWNSKPYVNPKLKIDVQVLLQPDKKYKVFFQEHHEMVNTVQKSENKEEIAYRNLVYQTVNQFLEASVGDQQGREQFYNLISSCTNGYITVENSSKQK